MPWHRSVRSLSHKGRGEIEHTVGSICASRSHLIRKPVPDFGAPTSLGCARRRWQYPDSRAGNGFVLFAVIPFAAEEMLSRRLAGECEIFWTAPCNRRTQANPRGLSERRQRYLMIHSRMGFHQIGEANPVAEQVTVPVRLQQFGRKSGLVQNLPELVLLMRVIGAGQRGCRSRRRSTQDDLERLIQQVVENIRQRRNPY